MNWKILTAASLLALILLIGGVVWYGENDGKVPSPMDVSGNQGQDAVDDLNVKTLADLIVQAQPISFSDVDTSDWETYADKDWGVAFKYPKDWTTDKVNGPINGTSTICVRTLDERFRKPESAGECSAQMNLYDEENLAFIKDYERYKEQFTSARSYRQKESGLMFLWNENNSLFVYVNIGDGRVVSLVNMWPEDVKNGIIRDVFYGIIETMRPL